MSRLRTVSLFSWSVEQNVRDTQMTTRVTKGASLMLALARAPLTKSEEKERLRGSQSNFCQDEEKIKDFFKIW